MVLGSLAAVRLSRAANSEGMPVVMERVRGVKAAGSRMVSVAVATMVPGKLGGLKVGVTPGVAHAGAPREGVMVVVLRVVAMVAGRVARVAMREAVRRVALQD